MDDLRVVGGHGPLFDRINRMNKMKCRYAWVPQHPVHPVNPVQNLPMLGCPIHNVGMHPCVAFAHPNP
jgi:hypothetical protein